MTVDDLKCLLKNIPGDLQVLIELKPETVEEIGVYSSMHHLYVGKYHLPTLGEWNKEDLTIKAVILSAEYSDH